MEFDLLLVGDGGVGKTCFLRRVLGETFEPKYYPTVNRDQKALDLTVNGVKFNVHDTVGQEKYWKPDRHYDCAIIMYDTLSNISYRNVSHWRKVCGDVPTIVCANKIDIHSNVSASTDVSVSAKNGINLDLPFEMLCKMLKKGIEDRTYLCR